MARIEMLESFRTGHPEIDADHWRLADIINAIHDALERDSHEACRRLFDDFIGAARDHFAREEKILYDSGFPRVAEHCVYHWRLLQRAHAVHGMCAEMADPRQISDCFDKLVEFFSDDILRGDLDFKSWLREKGLVDTQIE